MMLYVLSVAVRCRKSLKNSKYSDNIFLIRDMGINLQKII